MNLRIWKVSSAKPLGNVKIHLNFFKKTLFLFIRWMLDIKRSLIIEKKWKRNLNIIKKSKKLVNIDMCLSIFIMLKNKPKVKKKPKLEKLKTKK